MLSDSVVRLTGLFLVSLLIPGGVTAGGCKTDSDCQQHEACMKDVCGDIRVMCNNPAYCGEHATCEVRNHDVVCVCKTGHQGTPEHPCVAEPECRKHVDCPSNMTCTSSRRCEDPCAMVTCGENSVCVTTQHFMNCQCLPGFHRRDQGNMGSACKECLTHEHCTEDKMCVSDKCQDTCQFNMCGANTTCDVRDHHVFCDCYPWYVRVNPADVNSACKEVHYNLNAVDFLHLTGLSDSLSRDHNFTLQVYDTGLRITHLGFFINDEQEYKCTVTIIPTNIKQNFTKFEIAQSGKHKLYVPDTLDLANDGKPVLLPARTKYNINLKCDSDFVLYAYYMSNFTNYYMNLEFPIGEKKYYLSPVNLVYYGTMTPVSLT